MPVRSSSYHALLMAGIGWVVAACSTTYKISSEPEGAHVYHRHAGQKALLGQTPLTFEKSGLPGDAPFVLVFEKPGYDPLEMAVTPNDGSLTLLSATLKAGGGGSAPDPALARARAAVTRIFTVQDHVYHKRYVDALASLKELEATEPSLPEVYVLKGSVYYTLRDYEQAQTAWERALALDPTLDDVRVRVGKLRASSRGATP